MNDSPRTASLDQADALYTVAELRALEQAAARRLPPHTLMQRAGRAAAQWAIQLAGKPGARILAVAGPGNNGGDAIEAVAGLCQAGFDVHLVMTGEAHQLQGDAALAHQRAVAQDLPIHPAAAALPLLAQQWDLVIDGLFGIGLSRPIVGHAREVVQAMNSLACPLLALDLPSGLDADTGRVVGLDQGGVAVRASHTITFIADKPGLHTGAARDLVGQLALDSLEIDASLFAAPHAWRNTVAGFAHCLTPRRHDSHKGSFGDVIVLGGAAGMSGAPVLAARAALHCGAGRVFIAFVGPALPSDSGQPELMCREAAALDFAQAVIAAGPGMGDARDAQQQLGRALGTGNPLLLDADALNMLATDNGLRSRLAARRGATILTPHPLEAARLLGCSAAAVQADRLAAARELARSLNAVVVLKGSGSIIAQPDGELAINTTGNPALATAGSGDVLAGMAAALLAQGWPAREAAAGATWLHGAAADRLVKEGTGPIGMVASELVPQARSLLNALVAAHASGAGWIRPPGVLR